MPGNSFLPIGIYAARSRFSIGRVAECKIETPGSKRGCGFSKIHLYYFNGGFQAVFPDIGLGKACQLGLYFQSGDPVAGFLSERENERNDAAACSQFDNAVLGLDPCESGEQDCIQRKAISFFFLADKKLAFKKRVPCQLSCLVLQIISSSGDSGFIRSPLITLG